MLLITKMKVTLINLPIGVSRSFLYLSALSLASWLNAVVLSRAGLIKPDRTYKCEICCSLLYLSVEGDVALADSLWVSNVHTSRLWEGILSSISLVDVSLNLFTSHGDLSSDCILSVLHILRQ